jgi:hypothetical protein
VVHRTVFGVPGPVLVNCLLSGLDGGVRLYTNGLSGGAPDCPVSRLRQSRRSREPSQQCTAIIHRTVRWCTRLSGEPTVGRANGWPRNPRVTRGRANGQMGAPDSVWCANGSKSSTVDCAKFGKQFTPDCEQGMSGGAPDCPVRHPTEGKICLPGLLPTAPSCLGAIKGTPRRMEENTKHFLSIPKHQYSISTLLILCDSN